MRKMTRLDARSVHLALDETLSAADLQQLAVDIAAVRATLLPAVPATKPAPDDACLEMPTPAFRIDVAAHGALRLLVHNSGLGWQAFTFNAEQVDGLIDFFTELGKNREPITTGAPLPQGPHGGAH